MNVQVSPVNFWREGERFVAQCLATGTVSEGLTQEEALENLRQGVRLYLAGTAVPMLVPSGDLGFGP